MVVPSTSKKDQVLKLMTEKKKIEEKIAEFGKILSQNHVNMTESLIDEDGFPRNDIDVYQVRHARHQIICLQNDFKKIMEQIAKGIEEVHAESASQKTNTSPKTAGLLFEDTDTNKSPIAKINLVSPGSPAEDAGLMAGDDIIEFGSVNSTNFENLNTIGEVVKHKQNQRILLKVKRNGCIMEMNLTPKTWCGRGLLGCNIILPDSVER